MQLRRLLSSTTSAAATAAAAATKPLVQAKPIPRDGKLRTMYDLVFGGYFDKNKPLGMHPYIDAVRARHGDVFELKLDKNDPLVILNSPDDFMTVLRAEWAKPMGAASSSWPLVEYYKDRGYDKDGGKEAPFGVHPGDERWKKGRHAIQPEMFRHSTIDAFVPVLQNSAEDACKWIAQQPNATPTLADLTNRMAFEMIATVLIGKRMGLVTNQETEHTKRFVFHAQRAFHLMGVLQLMNPANGKKDASWPTFLADWDVVNESGAEMLEDAEREGKDGVLTRLMPKGKLSRERIKTELAGLLGAGVDTTSSVMQNCVYSVARYPHVQQRLREEVLRVIGPKGSPITAEKLKECHYLRAVNREQHRRHHTAAQNLRIEDFPIKLRDGEFEVPANRVIIFSQSAYAFDPVLLNGDPDLFLPERWLDKQGKYCKVRGGTNSAAAASEDGAEDQDQTPAEGELLGSVQYADLKHGAGSKSVNVFAPSLKVRHVLLETPFGIGPRQCIGGRIATLEIYTFLVEVRLAGDPRRRCAAPVRAPNPACPACLLASARVQAVRQFNFVGVNKETDARQILLRAPFPGEWRLAPPVAADARRRWQTPTSSSRPVRQREASCAALQCVRVWLGATILNRSSSSSSSSSLLPPPPPPPPPNCVLPLRYPATAAPFPRKHLQDARPPAQGAGAAHRLPRVPRGAGRAGLDPARGPGHAEEGFAPTSARRLGAAVAGPCRGVPEAGRAD
jgi:cytochrome P450